MTDSGTQRDFGKGENKRTREGWPKIFNDPYALLSKDGNTIWCTICRNPKPLKTRRPYEVKGWNGSKGHASNVGHLNAISMIEKLGECSEKDKNGKSDGTTPFPVLTQAQTPSLNKDTSLILATSPNLHNDEKLTCDGFMPYDWLTMNQKLVDMFVKYANVHLENCRYFVRRDSSSNKVSFLMKTCERNGMQCTGREQKRTRCFPCNEFHSSKNLHKVKQIVISRVSKFQLAEQFLLGKNLSPTDVQTIKNFAKTDAKFFTPIGVQLLQEVKKNLVPYSDQTLWKQMAVQQASRLDCLVHFNKQSIMEKLGNLFGTLLKVVDSALVFRVVFKTKKTSQSLQILERQQAIVGGCCPDHFMSIKDKPADDVHDIIANQNSGIRRASEIRISLLSFQNVPFGIPSYVALCGRPQLDNEISSFDEDVVEACAHFASITDRVNFVDVPLETEFKKRYEKDHQLCKFHANENLKNFRYQLVGGSGLLLMGDYLIDQHIFLIAGISRGLYSAPGHTPDLSLLNLASSDTVRKVCALEVESSSLSALCITLYFMRLRLFAVHFKHESLDSRSRIIFVWTSMLWLTSMSYPQHESVTIKRKFVSETLSLICLFAREDATSVSACSLLCVKSANISTIADFINIEAEQQIKNATRIKSFGFLKDLNVDTTIVSSWDCYEKGQVTDESWEMIMSLINDIGPKMETLIGKFGVQDNAMSPSCRKIASREELDNLFQNGNTGSNTFNVDNTIGEARRKLQNVEDAKADYAELGSHNTDGDNNNVANNCRDDLSAMFSDNEDDISSEVFKSFERLLGTPSINDGSILALNAIRTVEKTSEKSDALTSEEMRNRKLNEGWYETRGESDELQIEFNASSFISRDVLVDLPVTVGKDNEKKVEIHRFRILCMFEQPYIWGKWFVSNSDRIDFNTLLMEKKKVRILARMLKPTASSKLHVDMPLKSSELSVDQIFTMFDDVRRIKRVIGPASIS